MGRSRALVITGAILGGCLLALNVVAGLLVSYTNRESDGEGR